MPAVTYCTPPEVKLFFSNTELPISFFSFLCFFLMLVGPILLHPPNAEVQSILSVVGTPVACNSEGKSELPTYYLSTAAYDE